MHAPPSPPAAIAATESGTDDGAILFDARALPQAGPQLFDPAHWQAEGESGRGGRGAVWFLRGEFGDAVLRHYRRGGAVARLSRDRYLWTGAEQTRSFREFRLLAALHGRGLPVPAPLAARYQRVGPWSYRADILIRRIGGAHSLAEAWPALRHDSAALDALGGVLARFHAAGVCHADLNATNILRDGDGRWWLIDLDRGRLRTPEPGWIGRRLARLQRSLHKLGCLQSSADHSAWNAVVQAHQRTYQALQR